MYVKRNANNGRRANMRSSGKRVRTAAPHIELSNGGKVYLSSTSDYDPDAAHVYFVESNGEAHSDDVWNFGVNDLIAAVTEYVQQYVTLSDSDLDAIDQLVNNHYDNVFGAPGYYSYDKVFSNRKRVRAMRRRATGSPDEMGGGTNVVAPLKNDNRNLSDDLSLDAPLNDGADADNADYQPDKARERAMEARRRRRAMRRRAGSGVAESLAEDIVNDGPYADEGELYDAIMKAVERSLMHSYNVWSIAKEYCSDGDIVELFEADYADDVYNEVYKHDMSELIKDEDEDEDYDIYACRKANSRRGNMYVKRNAGKNRRAMRKRAATANELLQRAIEKVYEGAPYDTLEDANEAIDDAATDSVLTMDDAFELLSYYVTDDIAITEMFWDDFIQDIANSVDPGSLVGDNYIRLSRKANNRKRLTKQTRQSFRKRAQEADEDEDGDLPEFLEEGDDDGEGDEEESESEDEGEEPAEEPEEDREARRAAVRKAMKAARGKVQKGARRVDEPEKNKPQMRQPVRVQRRSANVAGKPAATYDDTCLFM